MHHRSSFSCTLQQHCTGLLRQVLEELVCHAVAIGQRLLTLQITSARDGMCLVISGSLRENVSSSVDEILRPCNYVNCFWVLLHSRCLHRSRPFTLGALRRAQKVLRLVALRCLSPLWKTIRRTSSRRFRCVVFFLCTTVLSFQPFACYVAPLCPMTGWVCQWKPFWTPVEDSFKKAYLEEWVFINNATSERSNSESQGDVIPETPEVSMPVSSSPWEPAKTQDKACLLGTH